MKKVVSLILVFLILILSGCTAKEPPVPAGLSAEDTVKLYFKYWNEMDSNGMNSLFISEHQLSDFDFFDKLEGNSVTLVSAVLDESKSGKVSQTVFDESFGTYNEEAFVNTKYTTTNKNNSDYTGDNIIINWQFRLIKNDSSNWVIVDFGSG